MGLAVAAVGVAMGDHVCPGAVGILDGLAAAVGDVGAVLRWLQKYNTRHAEGDARPAQLAPGLRDKAYMGGVGIRLLWIRSSGLGSAAKCPSVLSAVVCRPSQLTVGPS